MTIGAGDMHVFYDPKAFGTRCARRRADVDDVLFVGILGAVDEVVLDGFAVTAKRSLRYPTEAVDLDEGDSVLAGIDVDDEGVPILVDGAAQGGELYRVRREPWRINDGLETAALLS